MTIKLFNGSNWNNFARRIRIHAGSTWTNGIKSLKVYRDPGSSPFWDIAYPDLPVGTPPTVYANGIPNSSAAPGSVFSVNANMGNQDPLVFITTDYIKPQSVTYQWQRSLSTSGPWSNVGSSTTTYSNYLIQESDLNYYFRLRSVATNAKGSTTVDSFASGIVEDPRYIFNFGQPFGLNANAFIMFDSQGTTPFPNMDYLGFPLGRWLGYFVGDWKHYDVFYRSDANNFRIYHRLYRNDQVRTAGPTIEYEIVFTAGSNIVDVYVTNTVGTSFITSLNAYTKTFSFSGSYNLSDYNIGTRYKVTMTNPVSISTTRLSTDVSSNSVPIINASLTSNVATITTSQNHNLLPGQRTSIYGLTGSYAVLNGNWVVTEAPNGTVFRFSRTNSNLASSSVSGYATHPPSYPGFSYLGGWIDLGLLNDSTDGTYTFSSGSGQFSPVSAGVNGAFNKSNMFWPNQVQSITTTYQSSTSATLSWANAGTNSAFNAGSYSIEVKRNDNNVTVDGPRLVTSTNTTINGLVLGQGYTISISPNSRSDGGGQFSFANTATYNHATVPGEPTGVTGTAGNAQVALSWTAPSSNGGAAISSYRIQYSSNSGATWLPATPIDTGVTSTNFTVTQLTNDIAYIFRVAAVNSVGQGAWSANSASITPRVVATQIILSASTTPILTLGETSIITAQLRDANNNNVLESGRSITFSLNAGSPTGSSINTTSATTNSNGQATTTLTSGSGGGTATITAASSGLTSGSASVTIDLRPALTPTLTATGTGKGVSFSNTNRDANWTYGLWSGPTIGSLESGDSYNNAQFDILVPVLFNVRPTVTLGTRSATCDMTPGGTNVWTINRSTSVQIFSSRTGYFSGFSNTATGTSNRTSSRTFQWQFSTDGGSTWRTDWPAAFTGTTSQTLNWTGTPNTRRIRCRVDLSTGDGFSDSAFTSNEPTIP